MFFLILPRFFGIILPKISRENEAKNRCCGRIFGVYSLITRYGYDVFFTIAVICFAAIVGAFFLIELFFLKFFIIVVAFVFFLFALNFFRDPDRKIPQGKNLVLSPADGTIVVIKDASENEYLKSDAIQISIFMSPLNVHVNRLPVSGKVEYYRYVKGKYFAAFEDKASLNNEQTHIGINAGAYKIFFKQIAGFIARRIVCAAKVGDSVIAGDRFGMIKFGSRVDVFVPKNSDIKVSLNEKTVAGETVLAVVPELKVAS